MPGGSVEKLLNSTAPSRKAKGKEDYSVSTGDEFLDDVVNEVRGEVEDAVDFIFSEFEHSWEEAEEYYNGESSLPKVKGRSNVVKTLVRDAIRNIRPSLLRIFFKTDDIVKFEPGHPEIASLADQQTKYVNQLFHHHAGYKIIYDVFQDCALRKLGVAKYWYEDEQAPNYYSLENLTEDQYQEVVNDPNTTVLSEEAINMPFVAPEGATEMTLYNLDLVTIDTKPKIGLESIPLPEFFIARNAKNLRDARVYGHRRNMRVGDAVAMGLDHEDWTRLDAEDPEMYESAGSSLERRGFAVQPDEDSVDPVMQEVLITEAYARFDLYDIGVPQLWRFWFGGTSYELLDYEQVPDDEPGFALFSIDPEPHTVWGKSIFDIMKQEQDTATSILRAACDNAHASNNKRLVIVDNQVNVDDVLNNALNHPIRARQIGAVQELQTTSTVGAMLPLLQYLEEDAENKIGATRASLGLDPDALQSTTKDAVANTIQLAEGQIEVMAHNLAETGVRPLCEGLLRLSMRNLSPIQYVKQSGDYVPIDQSRFDPTMHMKVNVGLGTGQPEKKLAGLQFIYEEQQKIIGTMGIGNPIVTMDNVYNTLEDMAKLSDISDVSRYFNRLPPEMQEQMAMSEQQTKEQNQPTDPGTAMIEAERIKADLRAKEKRLEALLDARKAAQEGETDIWKLILEDDRERDKMAQDLHIKNTELGGRVALERVKSEQNKTRNTPAAPTGATDPNRRQ